MYAFDSMTVWKMQTVKRLVVARAWVRRNEYVGHGIFRAEKLFCMIM